MDQVLQTVTKLKRDVGEKATDDLTEEHYLFIIMEIFTGEVPDYLIYRPWKTLIHLIRSMLNFGDIIDEKSLLTKLYIQENNMYI